MTHATIAVGSRVRAQRLDSSTFVVTGKAAVVLAMVVLEGQAERRRLARVLWPDTRESQGRNNLRTLVHRLNQRFGGELLTGAEHLHIDSSQAHAVLHDTEELLAALDSGGAERCALLADAGLEADPSEALKEWLDAARQRLRRQQLARLSEAQSAALARSDNATAIALARACVRLEPLNEQGHRQLMDTLARCGDRAAALTAYEDCKQQLLEHLGVMPDVQTRTVQLRILQGQARTPSTPEPVASGLTPLGGAARYPLVEREAVLAAVQAALAQGVHVALQGEAGVGKTRLLRALVEQGAAEQVVIRPGARDEPYAAVAQLLQEVQPRRAVRTGVAEQVELARLAPMAFPDVQPSQASLSASRLHAALRHWVSRLGEAGVQRLVLDDLHYADAASQAAFGALLVPPESDAQAPPTLLMAHRSGEIDLTLAEALVAAQVRQRACCITLPRLSLDGVQALLQAMQAEHSQTQATRLLQRTGGNPLFVIELARHALEQAEQAGSGPAGANLYALLRSRLAGCSAPAQQLASVAGVAAEDFSVELAAAVSGQSPLALMPAWSELQQRGLFADHGLAHDLVRDAALGALPAAIGRTLHRQVAMYLEGHGLKGTRVLRHWLAAQDFDRALAQAVHQLHATTAVGLHTAPLEVELLALMARLSDAALLDNLWLSAEVDGSDSNEFIMDEHWPGLQKLVERVEQLVHVEAVADWLAFERARLTYFRDRLEAKAYAELCAAADRMSHHGVERARTEVFLAYAAHGLNDETRTHAMRAKAAASGLAAQFDNARLLGSVEALLATCSDIQALLRNKMSAMRAARRRHDLGAAELARFQMAMHCMNWDLPSSAYRYFRLDSRALLLGAGALHQSSESLTFGFLALNVGRFTQALQFLESVTAGADLAARNLYSTLVWVRLGQWARAKSLLQDVNLKADENDLNNLRAEFIARPQIDKHEGVDPLPAMRRVLARSLELGVDGLRRRFLEWDIASLTTDAHERIVIGTRLVDDLRKIGASRGRIVRILLDVAEAHAQAGSAGCRALAREAARDFRRGRGSIASYLPESLVRCAKLLEESDPSEAAALIHVARRWVHQALPHVPEFARRSFMTEVPVNRRLLGETA
jgi:DNA-binding SARP family transcriptional activator